MKLRLGRKVGLIVDVIQKLCQNAEVNDSNLNLQAEADNVARQRDLHLIVEVR